jgi:hypothetical protein
MEHKTASESRSGEVYSIQPYVIKFVRDLRQVGGFPPSYFKPVTIYPDNIEKHKIFYTRINWYNPLINCSFGEMKIITRWEERVRLLA